MWVCNLLLKKPTFFSGVLVKSTEEPENNIECVSLVGVSDKVMRKGIGRTLMNFVCDEAAKEGKNSVRLTVNEHSKQSLPFYLSLGFEVMPLTVGKVFFGPVAGIVCWPCCWFCCGCATLLLNKV